MENCPQVGFLHEWNLPNGPKENNDLRPATGYEARKGANSSFGAIVPTRVNSSDRCRSSRLFVEHGGSRLPACDTADYQSALRSLNFGGCRLLFLHAALRISLR